MIKNLTISSDVDDEYHRRYVQKLKDAQCVKENRVQEYAMLEKHILEARAKALAYEEREDIKRNKICENPDNFGVPPGIIKNYKGRLNSFFLETNSFCIISSKPSHILATVWMILY